MKGQHPIWRTAPCASWCEIKHGQLDHPVNRECHGGQVEQTLRLHQAMPRREDLPELLALCASLEQTHTETAPRVLLYTSDGAGEMYEMALDEAEQFARSLLALVELGKEGAQ